MTTEAQHQALLSPDIYPHPAASIEFRETHISRLYLTEKYVYKLKKPLNFGFLDFTTLEKRYHFCHEEVRLNERCCPDTYLGVVTIHQNDSQYSIDGSGPIVDYAVKMKRLPADRMLDRLIEENDQTLPSEMKRLARQLATFHKSMPPLHPHQPTYRATMRHNWRENLEQTKPYIGKAISPEGFRKLCDWLEGYYRHQRRIFIDREQAGFVREGHGDLHTEHICLTDPIRIYDCIEFNERFRHIDLADDLAFLCMDLEYRERPDLAQTLLSTYQEQFDIKLNEELLRFYRIYRAWVRGKVEAFLSDAATAPDAVRNAALQRARRYFNLALGDLTQPSLTLISGLMGVGKSTLARSLMRASRAVLLRSDLIRKQLVDDSAGSDRAAFRTGVYSQETSERTYRRLFELARNALSKDRSVIVDASFMLRRERNSFREQALKMRIPCHLLHLYCPKQLALKRLAERQSAGTDESDGRPELYHRQQTVFEPIGKNEAAIEVETTDEDEILCGKVLCQILMRESKHSG